jgi:4-alpha-glucanotransferase
MRLSRGSGILLHPTSLPGPHGSGSIGSDATEFVRWLARAGQRYWQVLPLAPSGYGNSPYSAMSAFASNPMLVDLAGLVEKGWLSKDALDDPPSAARKRIDFPTVETFRWRALQLASDAFFARPAGERTAYDEYCSRQAAWLDDYSHFMALNTRYGGQEWARWPAALAARDATALASAAADLQPSIRLHKFTQWVFSEQWGALRAFAHEAGIQIIGDIPIFVAFHSAEVWSHRELFYLAPDGEPTVVAGVPPDYFSKTGQRWGNPLYRWDALASRGFDWWIDRFRAVFEQVDIARLDHFRGFAGYWEIPATEPTAVKGRWVPAPGAELFEAVRQALGNDLPIIAEDLGVITPDVVALRERFEFPGMKVLQFAFDSGAKNPFLPHNYAPSAVAYTGTHDNDTTRGWYATAPEAQREFARRYLRTDGSEFHWDLIRLAASSVADVAIYPMQDVLGLDASGRMNTPGIAGGNWGWRFRWEELPAGATERLREAAELFGRVEATGSGDDSERD